jgi:hypothetical protein
LTVSDLIDTLERDARKLDALAQRTGNRDYAGAAIFTRQALALIRTVVANRPAKRRSR